ncbi:MAG: hypothetical protein IJC99_05845 [Clostridia bacterium]|nr:hypothetical protein [Clostridia bacterium]
MKELVGITKEIDALGRLVIPKEFREALGLQKQVEIILTKNGVLVRSPKFQLTEIK